MRPFGPSGNLTSFPHHKPPQEGRPGTTGAADWAPNGPVAAKARALEHPAKVRSTAVQVETVVPNPV